METVKTSKIKKVVSTKPFTNSFGTTIYHNLEMENGEKISIGKKKELKEGWEVTYSIVDEQSGEYMKAKSEQQQTANNTAPTGNGGAKYQQKDSEVITMLSCISSACVAVQQSQHNTDTKLIIDMAEKFYQAAMAKKPQ